MWKCIAECVCGSAHAAVGRGCEDYVAVNTIGDRILIAACDGVGSARNGREGAKYAARSLIYEAQRRRVFVQRMKTKWGSCNHRAGTIRLNTDLAKKPKECLEYIIAHEMAHLLEPILRSYGESTHRRGIAISGPAQF
ncbi:MAG: SprT-like domain-containing protein [Pirellulales bacterium]|nr:SprT-like domain-containing protein [Pirellulales bacterium]